MEPENAVCEGKAVPNGLLLDRESTFRIVGINLTTNETTKLETVTAKSYDQAKFKFIRTHLQNWSEKDDIEVQVIRSY